MSQAKSNIFSRTTFIHPEKGLNLISSYQDIVFNYFPNPVTEIENGTDKGKPLILTDFSREYGSIIITKY